MAKNRIWGYRPLSEEQHQFLASTAAISYGTGGNRSGKTLLNTVIYPLIQCLDIAFLPPALQPYKMFGKGGMYQKAWDSGYRYVNDRLIKPETDFRIPTAIRLMVPNYTKWVNEWADVLEEYVPRQAIRGDFERWISGIGSHGKKVRLYDLNGDVSGKIDVFSYSPNSDTRNQEGITRHALCWDELPDNSKSVIHWVAAEARVVQYDGFTRISGTPDTGGASVFQEILEPYRQAGETVFREFRLKTLDNYRIDEDAANLRLGGTDPDIQKIKMEGIPQILNGYEWRSFNNYLGKDEAETYLRNALKDMRGKHVVLGADWGTKRAAATLLIVENPTEEMPEGKIVQIAETLLDKRNVEGGIGYDDLFNSIVNMYITFGFTPTWDGQLVTQAGQKTELIAVGDKSGANSEGRYNTGKNMTMFSQFEAKFGCRPYPQPSTTIDPSYAATITVMKNGSYFVAKDFCPNWVREHSRFRLKKKYLHERELKSSMIPETVDKDVIDSARYAVEVARLIIANNKNEDFMDNMTNWTL